MPEAAVEVSKLLTSLPDDRAFDLLRVLRNNEDAATALSIFRGNTELGPDYVAPRAVRNSLETELMEKNPAAYPPLLPIVPSILAASNLLRPARESALVSQESAAATVNGIFSEAISLSPLSGVPETWGHTTAGTASANRNASPRMNASSGVQQQRFGNTPRQEIDYCDARLGQVDISFWTDIEVTSDFAARVISLYIKTDHPLLGLFSPDLFIADLVAGQERFCSRFLFHALMYFGCQMYSAFDKSAIPKAETFCREAETLWEIEKDIDSYLTMAGVMLLSLSLIGHGKDHKVHSYAHEAINMGIRLGLFEGGNPQNMNMLEKMPRDDMVARCHAAWGAFNWNVLISMFYRQPGSYCPVAIPTVPIPGDEVSRTTPGGLLGDPPSAHENLLGSTFPALCHFWRIIQGARWIYYPDQDEPLDAFKLVHVEYKFRELIAWAEALPRALVRTKQTPHHVAVFHIWLHCAILDILRRFRKEPTGEEHRMATFSAWNSTIDAAFAASVNQLKSLIVEYRTNYMASAYSILWHSGLIYLANAVLQDTSDSDWRVYFLLCIYGYESLCRPYRISEVIAQGLLSMMLRDTNMPADEARGILEDLKERGLDHVKKNMENEIRATFMLDLTLALRDPVEATAENMAKQFDSLAVFQDFIDQSKMEM